MHSINLSFSDDNTEFERAVGLLILHNGYLRVSWARLVQGVWIRTLVIDVPSAQLDAVLDSWLGV